MKVDGRNYDEIGSTKALRCIGRVDILEKKFYGKNVDWFPISSIHRR